MRRRTGRWQLTRSALLQSPPRLVEAIMLLLALVMLVVWWLVNGWQYLLLCLSYLVGAIASILVRETLHPSACSNQIRCTAFISLLLVLTIAAIYLDKTLPAMGLLSPY